VLGRLRHTNSAALRSKTRDGFGTIMYRYSLKMMEMLMKVLLLLTAAAFAGLTVIAGLRASGNTYAVNAITRILELIPDDGLPWIGACLAATTLTIICAALAKILRLLESY
jgi:hypothetical protein